MTIQYLPARGSMHICDSVYSTFTQYMVHLLTEVQYKHTQKGLDRKTHPTISTVLSSSNLFPPFARHPRVSLVLLLGRLPGLVQESGPLGGGLLSVTGSEKTVADGEAFRAAEDELVVAVTVLTMVEGDVDTAEVVARVEGSIEAVVRDALLEDGESGSVAGVAGSGSSGMSPAGTLVSILDPRTRCFLLLPYDSVVWVISFGRSSLWLSYWPDSKVPLTSAR